MLGRCMRSRLLLPLATALSHVCTVIPRSTCCAFCRYLHRGQIDCDLSDAGFLWCWWEEEKPPPLGRWLRVNWRHMPRSKGLATQHVVLDKHHSVIQSSRHNKGIISRMEEEVRLEEELGRKTTSPTLSVLCGQLYLCTVPSGNRV